jgi:DHA2 family multidrug resistance protein
MIGESTTGNSPRGQDYLHALNSGLGGGDPVVGSLRGMDVFVQQVQKQATVMAYSDLFWVFGLILIVSIPLVLLLRPVPQGDRHPGGR